jgi:hypothetical protein
LIFLLKKHLKVIIQPKPILEYIIKISSNRSESIVKFNSKYMKRFGC